MKKIFISILSMILVSVIMTSCFDTTTSVADEMELRQTTIDVSLPGTTRTVDGVPSDMVLYYQVIDLATGLPYITQTSTRSEEIQYIPMDDACTATISCKLPKNKDFKLVCWAQAKDNDCYDVTDLQHVAVNYHSVSSCGDDMLAYRGCANLTSSSDDEVSMNLTLSPAVAGVKIMTLVKYIGIELAQTVELEGAKLFLSISDIPTTYNVVDNVMQDYTTHPVNLGGTEILTDETVDGDNTYQTLNNLYLLAGYEYTCNMAFEIVGGDGAVKQVTLGKVRLKPEYTSVIKDAFFCIPIIFEVTVDEWNDQVNNIEF